MMDIHLIAYFLGIAIVFGSHLLMLVAPHLAMRMFTTHQHIVANLFACACIAFYFMSREKYIKY
jgi:hypothetical protein